MKILLQAVLILGMLGVVMGVKPPTAICRSSPLPSQIPITVGEELRFDLEDVFSGYNLFMNGSNQSHITISEKYTVLQSNFSTSYNFQNVKLRGDRFVGLVSNGAYSNVIIGKSNDSSGIIIDHEIQIESSDNLHCFDADVVLTHNGSVVVADCAAFYMGQVVYNVFIYVNLTDMKVIEGGHIHDTFVRYNHVSKRRIEVIEDPFTRISYLFRFHLRDGVSAEHQDQTYMQIFMMNNPLYPQLLDVIDHTFLELDSLSIADYQVHMNFIYLLVYNKGVYELRLTPDQYVVITTKFDMKMDMTRFRVDQLGFNDDLNLVLTNGHTVYQFQWDVTTPPVLMHKYTLAPNSKVDQIFVDYNYVIVVGQTVFGDQLVKRTWVFTKSSNSYLNAYNVFHAPLNSPHIILWNQHGSILHIFHNYNAFYIKMSLPYLNIKPVNSSMANTTETYEVQAISYGDNQDQANCTEKFQFIYVMPNDKRILKTGLWPRNQIFVDSPDSRQIPLSFQFYGANLTYNVSFESSSIAPHAYVDKQHRATFKWPTQIKPETIVFYQMFSEITREQQKPTAIYGLIQTGESASNKTIFTTYYITCKINVFDRDEVHSLDCKTIYTTRFSMGKILMTSQMFDPEERRIAIIFESEPYTVYVYYFWPEGMGFYGRKAYAGDVGNRVTGVSIDEGKLFVVLQYGKRVDILSLEDLLNQITTPRMVIDSNFMRFFGVNYFAPVGIKVSRFHKEAIFLQTKSGVMALNVNEAFMPQLLFTVPTTNIRYDFQVNHEHLLILTETTSTLYELQVPLRRNDPPLKRQSIDSKFRIGQYDEICSDRLFYIVGVQAAYIINPSFLSISAVYSEIWAADQIISVDAVNIQDREIFFMRTKTQISAYVLSEDPKLTVSWDLQSTDFNMSLSAYNPGSQSEPYSLKFNVLNFNETIIQPTPDFNSSEVRKIGRVKSPSNNATFYANIDLNDSNWFQGTITKYEFSCGNPDCANYTSLRNHVELTRDVVIEGRSIYDIQSTMDGIYAQQYSSLFKSYVHNDSIHFINKIPTTVRGQVCSKLATGGNEQYVISLCQLGTKVNVYITSLVGSKPFTFGPYATDAQAVNHAKIVGNILMIVDNEDNPFVRPGGIYLYHLNFDIDDPDFISLLDYIDYDDLQIEGFSGTPFIGSADLHLPFSQIYHEYRLFLTEVRTGAIFSFGFEVSADGEELVYLSKRFIPLQKIIPTELKYPTPLRVQTINIHYFFDDNKTVEYYLLLSVSNWHHMEIQITLDHNDEILGHKLERLFERFPWSLQNYFKYRRGRLYQTYFAVPYVNYDQSKQFIIVYTVPFILNHQAKSYDQKYSQHFYELYMGIPILRAFGAHAVRDTFQTAFAFHTFGNDKLLWTDMDGSDISELTLFKNITLSIQGMTTPNDTITISAVNPYSNYSFMVDIDFWKDKDDDDKGGKNYLWVVIIGIAVFMIVGIVVAYVRQRLTQDKHHHHHPRQGLSETLITTEERDSRNINRSSVDPESVRGSIEPANNLPAQNKEGQKVEEPQRLPEVTEVQEVQEVPQGGEAGQNDSSSSGDEVADLTH